MGLLTMLVVAYSNALTSILLLKASGKTGHDTYEGVAQAAGGPVLKASAPLRHYQLSLRYSRSSQA